MIENSGKYQEKGPEKSNKWSKKIEQMIEKDQIWGRTNVRKNEKKLEKIKVEFYPTHNISF